MGSASALAAPSSSTGVMVMSISTPVSGSLPSAASRAAVSAAATFTVWAVVVSSASPSGSVSTMRYSCTPMSCCTTETSPYTFTAGAGVGDGVGLGVAVSCVAMGWTSGSGRACRAGALIKADAITLTPMLAHSSMATQPSASLYSGRRCTALPEKYFIALRLRITSLISPAGPAGRVPAKTKIYRYICLLYTPARRRARADGRKNM